MLAISEKLEPTSKPADNDPTVRIQAGGEVGRSRKLAVERLDMDDSRAGYVLLCPRLRCFVGGASDQGLFPHPGMRQPDLPHNLDGG